MEEVPNFNIPVDNPFNIPIPSFKVKKPSFDDDDDDDFIHKRRSSIDSISKSPKLGGSPIKFKSNFSRGFSTRSLDEINMEPRPDADTAVLSEEISSHKRRKTTESVEDELQ